MKCPNCGHQAVERMGGILIVDTSCAKCGTSLIGGTPPAATPDPPAKTPLNVHVYRLAKRDRHSWAVTKHGPCGTQEMGTISDTRGLGGGGLSFQPHYHLSGCVPASLAANALPAFLSHVAYDALDRAKLRETTTGAAMEVEITLMGTHGDQLEYIASEIPEVPGLFGMLGCGWPPRELDPEEHRPCD